MTTQPTSELAQENDVVPAREKVAFLSAPAAYPARPGDVEVKETHMSWVFLAGDTVYKLKKPVKYPFLDFSTLAAREADCRLEDQLNRRLAPDVYLGVVPLTRDADGALAIGGDGATVDWLVKMRRLPADRMLDRSIQAGTVTRDDIAAVADVLAGFYSAAPPVDVTPRDYIALFAREHDENRAILTRPDFDLPRDGVGRVLDAVSGVLGDEPGLLNDRVQRGHIVEGHGDLRPEHVCLVDPPVIIDCLEFKRSFRLLDPFDELTFLGMECERLTAPWIGEILVARAAEALENSVSDRLLAFYTAYRASLRARLSLAHLLEPEPREPGKWLPQACEYLAIAERASLRLRPRAARPASRPRGGAG